MRTIGFVLLLFGGFVMYLGFQGKVGSAWTALKTGKGATV